MIFMLYIDDFSENMKSKEILQFARHMYYI